MMKLLVALFTLFSVSAFAIDALEVDQELDILTPAHHCQGVNLSQAQKADIKRVVIRTKMGLRRMAPAIMRAHGELKRIMMDKTTTKSEAVSAVKTFKQATKPAKRLKRQAALEVNFDILSGEQRVKLLKCKQQERSPRPPRRHPRTSSNRNDQRQHI
jgi:Spy/CpxP family protein refolding chaperone